ncbi:MAG: family 20 glycosylhydrolase, partial [Bacteroidales bacterium]|nr:family 20 glycosylhydrolase [Bacteroidales bacterium]
VLEKDESQPAEGYRLTVGRRRVKVYASDAAGAFYGLQSFRQLLPGAAYSDKPVEDVAWKAQCCRIEDAPRIAWRGMQLDCCRYFYPVETVKEFLDMMAMHKQNRFHWHLTEDQGWRLEIKAFPRLTEVGAWRDETAGYDDKGDGVRHGGFYTQDEIRDIVEYARHRFITVIPEIELPGHASAAIAAYPELSCTPDEPKKVATTWGIKKDVFCPSPTTFSFLEKVFDEVLELFPSEYIHIGGDECPKDAWNKSAFCRNLAKELGLSGVDDLQYYFVKHFDSYLRERGRTVIGWDEILDGSAVQSTVVMSYRGHKPAIRAMERDMKVILCPNRWCYYDYHQNEIEDIPRNHHLFITLRKAYNYDPVAQIGDSLYNAKGDLILGYEACVWGEFIPDTKQLEHQAFPRAAAIAEFCWSKDENRDFADFCTRIPKEFERLDARGINYSKAFYNVIVNMNLEEDYPRDVELEIDVPGAVIRYTTDGTEPDASSPVAPSLLHVNKGDVIKARGFTAEGEPLGVLMTREFGK